MTVTDTDDLPAADRLADPRRAPPQGPHAERAGRGRCGTSQSAVVRIEQGQQNLSLETLARIGESLDSEFVSLGHSGRPAPAHRRAARSCTAPSTSRRRRTPPSPCCARRCSTGAARRCATSPGSRRSTGSSRCCRRSASRPAGCPTATTSRSCRRPSLDLDGIDVEAARRTRTVIMFLGPLLHDQASSASRTPAAATSARAPSSPTCPRCGPSGSTSSPPTASTRPTSTRAAGRRAHRPHRAR